MPTTRLKADNNSINFITLELSLYSLPMELTQITYSLTFTLALAKSRQRLYSSDKLRSWRRVALSC